MEPRYARWPAAIQQQWLRERSTITHTTTAASKLCGILGQDDARSFVFPCGNATWTRSSLSCVGLGVSESCCHGCARIGSRITSDTWSRSRVPLRSSLKSTRTRRFLQILTAIWWKPTTASAIILWRFIARLRVYASENALLPDSRPRPCGALPRCSCREIHLSQSLLF